MAADLQLGGETISVLAVHPRPPIGKAQDWRLEHAALAESAADADLVMGDVVEIEGTDHAAVVAELGLT